MHFVAITILIVVLLLIIINRQHFIASYDMMINRATNPNWVRYHGREKDPWGKDYYDTYLGRQLYQDNHTIPSYNGDKNTISSYVGNNHGN